MLQGKSESRAIRNPPRANRNSSLSLEKPEFRITLILIQCKSEFEFLLGQIKISRFELGRFRIALKWSTKKLKYNRERYIQNILKYKNPFCLCCWFLQSHSQFSHGAVWRHRLGKRRLGQFVVKTVTLRVSKFHQYTAASSNYH